LNLSQMTFKLQVEIHLNTHWFFCAMATNFFD
jgi:hypothetical protein